LLPSRFAARRRYRRCLSRLSVWVALSGLVTGVSVSAQEPSGKPLLSATQVTGDWGGARPKLEDRGVRFSLFYNHYYGHKDAGGLEPTSHGRHSGSFDFFGQLDFDTMNAIRGGEALIHVKSNRSRNINPQIGALGDPIDDADGDHAVSIAQLWYQHSSPARTLQVRLGYLDQQTILDRNAFANSEDRQFMSTFLDNNSAIVPLAVGPGVAVFYNATHWLSFVAAVADAKTHPRTFSFATAFDGEYYTYFETDLRAQINSASGPLTGNYRFGFFTDPRDRIAFSGDRTEQRNEGFYLSFDQVLYGESTGDDQGAGLFFRYGWRPADVNRITHFWSAGAQYKGVFPRGDQQTIGFGVYSAIGSDLYRDQIDPTFDRETAYEVYYTLQLRPALVLTPAVQYVDQPGALTTRDSVFVIAFRARISL